jgi:hypothetical protein
LKLEQHHEHAFELSVEMNLPQANAYAMNMRSLPGRPPAGRPGIAARDCGGLLEVR